MNSNSNITVTLLINDVTIGFIQNLIVSQENKKTNSFYAPLFGLLLMEGEKYIILKS